MTVIGIDTASVKVIFVIFTPKHITELIILIRS